MNMRFSDSASTLAPCIFLISQLGYNQGNGGTPNLQTGTKKFAGASSLQRFIGIRSQPANSHKLDAGVMS